MKRIAAAIIAALALAGCGSSAHVTDYCTEKPNESRHEAFERAKACTIQEIKAMDQESKEENERIAREAQKGEH